MLVSRRSNSIRRTRSWMLSSMQKRLMGVCTCSGWYAEMSHSPLLDLFLLLISRFRMVVYTLTTPTYTLSSRQQRRSASPTRTSILWEMDVTPRLDLPTSTFSSLYFYPPGSKKHIIQVPPRTTKVHRPRLARLW